MTSYDDVNEFLSDGPSKGNAGQEAKYNVFKFQDHLNYWIGAVSACFQMRNYTEAFEALQNLYLDTYGGFTPREQQELDSLYHQAEIAYSEYLRYNIQYEQIRQKIKNQTYRPPIELATTLIKFRKKLMTCMWGHNMLLIMVRKDNAGAGSVL